MMESVDPAPSHPRIVVVWAPRCIECRAMRPVLQSVARQYQDRIDLIEINAAQALPGVRRLRVKATPALIGLRDGAEVFRVVGRRSRSELEALFASLSSGGRPVRTGVREAAIRMAAGAVLVGTGLGFGTAWPLVAIGAGAIVYGLLPLARMRAWSSTS